jgi:hypothetical protein
MHVEQGALHSIQQKANDNYNDFMASRDRAFKFCMGKLSGAITFLDIDANVDDREPFIDVEEKHFIFDMMIPSPYDGFVCIDMWVVFF